MQFHDISLYWTFTSLMTNSLQQIGTLRIHAYLSIHYAVSFFIFIIILSDYVKYFFKCCQYVLREILSLS